jgi:hypothetical protein
VTGPPAEGFKSKRNHQACYDSEVPQNDEPSGGPYLTAIFFCEKALREADGVLSFVRVVDKWTLNSPGETMAPAVLPMTVVVMMKSGVHRGSGQITLTPRTPSGETMPPIHIPVQFEGDNDRGVTASGMIGFPVKEPGAYWFEVSLDGQVLTRTAIRVAHMRIPSQNPQQQNPS